ncbi:MAG: VWA domain-containing protein [Myxococcales bacterium]|nr:VWA domain-containing protein [Myxococcales bacterium]
MGSGGAAGDGTTDGASSDTDAGQPCEEVTRTVQTIAPDVVLVLDKSSGMVTPPRGTWDGDGDADTPDVTRWSSVYQALAGTNDSYAIDLGVKLFPAASAKDSGDGEACLVDAGLEVPVMAMNKAAALAAIPGPDDTTLAGATPMAAALSSAIEQLLLSDDPGAPRALVLVTNGAANCAAESVGPALFEVYDDQVHAIVADAYTDHGIPTHVIGLAVAPGTTPNVQDGLPDGVDLVDTLNALAVAGGRPAPGPELLFMNATSTLELTQFLNDVLLDALGCLLELGQEPAFPDDVEVVVAGAAVPRVADCAAGSGWRYVHEDGPYDRIEVCGSACYDLKFAGEADVAFYCSAG